MISFSAGRSAGNSPSTERSVACKTLHLGQHNIKHSLGDNHLIQTVERDLGIGINNQLKFREQEQLQQPPRRRSPVIRRSFALLNETTLPLLFRSMARPHLEYANQVWRSLNRDDHKRIELVQRRATKLDPEIRDRPYEERLRILSLTSLCHRRRRGEMLGIRF